MITLFQRWANYGPRAACGPQGSHTYIFGVYVKVSLSIRLELPSFFPHVLFETAFLLNLK